jgi:hypothetical protein
LAGSHAVKMLRRGKEITRTARACRQAASSLCTWPDFIFPPLLSFRLPLLPTRMAPFSLLCLSVFLLTPLSLAQGPIHIPLVRRSSIGARSFDYVSEAERLRDRYGYTRSNETTKRATGAIPIINQVCRYCSCLSSQLNHLES